MNKTATAGASIGTGMTRRALLLGLGAALAARARSARGPRSPPSSPTSSRPARTRRIRSTSAAQEAIDRIREATDGRLEIKLFPANQLGSDTDLLARCATAASSSSTCRPRSWPRWCRRPVWSTSASPSARVDASLDGRWTASSASTSRPRSSRAGSLTVSPSAGPTGSARSPRRPGRSRRRTT